MVAGAVTSQSAVGRLAAEKQHGVLGMIKNPYVTLTCTFAALGCIMYGYDQGVMGPILVMENFQAQFPDLQGDTIQGWLVASLELGAWAGSLFCGYTADAISRKYSMNLAAIIFTVGTCLQCAAKTSGVLFAGRIIGGIGIGMFSMVVPLYQAEIAPPELRGSLVSLQQLSITIGITIAFFLDYGFHFIGSSECKPYNVPEADWYIDGDFNYDAAHGHLCSGQKDIDWRFPIAFQMIFAWILFVGMFFLPHSPRWLAMKHRDEACLASLSKLRRLPVEDPVLQAEYLEIKAAVMFDEEVEGELKAQGGFLSTWKPLFAMNMQKRVWIGIFIMIFQQFTGINSVLYYAPQIFSSFGLTSTTVTLLATGVTGIFQVIFTIPSVLYLDKFGRKQFLIVGALGMMICHLIVAGIEGSYISAWAEGRAAGAGWACVVFIWIFAINFSYSWGPVAWVLAQEIFPNSMRSKGVAVTASCNWMFNFVIGLTTKDMLAASGMSYGTYIFFAVFCAGGAMFVWKCVPETKDRTLEELDMYFGGDSDSIAQADKVRMDRIYASLGLDGIDRPEDLREKTAVHHDDAGVETEPSI